MSDVAIRVENLGKQYRIGKAQRRHDTLRDALVASLQAPFNPLRRNTDIETKEREDTIWALKDVSFDVKHGEVVGIIGRNGAGKSTLLKILSRITEPTTGRAIVNGRVGSLLEVGTGFHPELTGRENIYLNGAILGMKRTEIDRKFDEIVDFAEIAQFLDTPVKHYSSGMYVRLAFAVAAHLQTEVLVVDEVLTVGDSEFQKKCIGKMGNIATGGRTIIFVSHNMALVEGLCPNSIAINHGSIVQAGASKQVIESYLSMTSKSATTTPLKERQDRVGSGETRFTDIRLFNGYGQPTAQVRMGEPLVIEADYEVLQAVREPIFGFLVVDQMGKTVLRAYSRESFRGPTPRITRSGTVRCRFESLPLMYDTYSIHLWLGRIRYPVDYVEWAISFDVLQYDVYHSGRPPDSLNGGVCFAKHTWDLREGA